MKYFTTSRWNLPRQVCSFRGAIKITLKFALLLVLIIYVVASLTYHSKYTGIKSGHCRNRTPEETDHLIDLTLTVHRLLNDMKIEHWLCYGSVFGALRFQAPLPWDDDVDICMNGDGLYFATMNVSHFISAFYAAGLHISEHWSRRGLFQVQRDPRELHKFRVDLFTYFRYGHWMKRAGWDTWLLFIHYNKYHAFPARLVHSPLPSARFGSGYMPVPRDGIEIQKYFYPNDWSRVVRPEGCGS